MKLLLTCVLITIMPLSIEAGTDLSLDSSTLTQDDPFFGNDSIGIVRLRAEQGIALNQQVNFMFGAGMGSFDFDGFYIDSTSLSVGAMMDTNIFNFGVFYVAESVEIDFVTQTINNTYLELDLGVPIYNNSTLNSRYVMAEFDDGDTSDALALSFRHFLSSNFVLGAEYTSLEELKIYTIKGQLLLNNMALKMSYSDIQDSEFPDIESHMVSIGLQLFIGSRSIKSDILHGRYRWRPEYLSTTY